jgi:hypothetical protein
MTWPARKQAGFLADYWCWGCFGLSRERKHGIHCNGGTAKTKRRKPIATDVIEDGELELGETFGDGAGLLD